MIRTMKPEDWEQVRDIFAYAIEEGKSTVRTVCPTWEEWDSAHRPDCRLVAEENGRVIGWVALSPISLVPAYSGLAEVSIYIAPDRRNHGIGGQLLRALCNESEKAGYWMLESRIFEENEASIALHTACGFRKVGYREKIAKDRFGRWLNTILMERRKKDPSAEGTLGVEGMERELLYNLLSPYANAEAAARLTDNPLSKTDLYTDGLTGGEGSADRRDEFASRIGLPSGMTPNALLAALRVLLTYEEYLAAVGRKSE